MKISKLEKRTIGQRLAEAGRSLAYDVKEITSDLNLSRIIPAAILGAGFVGANVAYADGNIKKVNYKIAKYLMENGKRLSDGNTYKTPDYMELPSGEKVFVRYHDVNGNGPDAQDFFYVFSQNKYGEGNATDYGLDGINEEQNDSAKFTIDPANCDPDGPLYKNAKTGKITCTPKKDAPTANEIYDRLMEKIYNFIQGGKKVK